MDLWLDVDGDLALSSTGDAVVVDGVDAIAQHIRVRFRVFLGECAFDLRIGFPWFEHVLVKRANLARIRSLVRSTIETTPGVASVGALTVALDRARRRLAVTFVATTDTGEIVGSASFGPFVLVPGGV